MSSVTLNNSTFPVALNQLQHQPKYGYNSHGVWATIGKIRDAELERDNDFPALDYPSDTPAIWICLKPRAALRYLALAEEWERLNSKSSLTATDREMLKEIARIQLQPTDIVACTDYDDGYLILRPVA